MSDDAFRASVSRETYDDLSYFADQLQKWTKKINLIAPSTADDIWRRHIQDSTQLYKHAPNQSFTWIDLGSGGGLPVIPLAIFTKHREDQKYVAIESDQRKCAFLRKMALDLRLNLDVKAQRIDSLSSFEADYISARALTSLSNLLNLSQPFMKPSTTCFYFKGEQYKSEISAALEHWSFEVQIHPSHTQTGAAILEMKDIQRASSS